MIPFYMALSCIIHVVVQSIIILFPAVNWISCHCTRSAWIRSGVRYRNVGQSYANNRREILVCANPILFSSNLWYLSLSKSSPYGTLRITTSATSRPSIDNRAHFSHRNSQINHERLFLASHCKQINEFWMILIVWIEEAKWKQTKRKKKDIQPSTGASCRPKCETYWLVSDWHCFGTIYCFHMSQQASDVVD